MKTSTKITVIIFILLVSILGTGCDEEIKDGLNKPSLNFFYLKGSDNPDSVNSDIYMEAMGGNYSFSVVSSFAEPKIASNDSWLDFKSADYSSYNLSVDYNNSLTERIGKIRIISPEQGFSDIVLNIHQSGRSLSLNQNGQPVRSVDKINFPAEGGSSLAYEIRADGEYTVSKDSKDTWYSIIHSTDNKTFYVSSTSNSTTTNRKGQITIALSGLPTGESLNVDIIVTQYCNHEWVDLGLPSGLKWATCNVGASSPEEYGDYFAWGETSMKSDYSEKNSLTSKYYYSESELKANGIIDSYGNLTASYDAARTNWGGSWRMPTREECQELIDKCTWIWTTRNGNDGYQVNGPNGKSIFLPCARSFVGTSLTLLNEGEYWSATMRSGFYAYILKFYNSTYKIDTFSNTYGHSIRPVIK